MIHDFFSSFFSSYILLSITVLIVLLGAIYLYINSRISEQNHRLAIMTDAIKSMMHDTQIIRSQLMNYASNAQEQEQEVPIQDISGGGGGNPIVFDKITVSDDENSEYDTDDEEDDLSSSSSDSNFSIDENTHIITMIPQNIMDVSMVGTNMMGANMMMNLEQNDKVEELNDVENIDIDIDIDMELNSVPLNSPIVVEEKKENDDDLMEVKASDHDLKKMSVGALRTLVIEKGLCDDPSKMKKADLLTMLA